MAKNSTELSSSSFRNRSRRAEPKHEAAERRSTVLRVKSLSEVTHNQTSKSLSTKELRVDRGRVESPLLSERALPNELVTFFPVALGSSSSFSGTTRLSSLRIDSAPPPHITKVYHRGALQAHSRRFSLFRSSPLTKAPALQTSTESSVSSQYSHFSQPSKQSASNDPMNKSTHSSTSAETARAKIGSDDRARRDPEPAAERKQQEQNSTTHGLDQINTLLRHPTLYDPILKPRLPIVLCHGLYGFDVKGPSYFRLHYWGDLLSILRGKVGADVFVTAVPGTGSIKQRAHSLHRLLEENEEARGKDLNFLAHSMGGLDARYLFSQIKPESYNPRSLTTLSTPHRGSEFMAWCRANIGIGTDYDISSAEAARLAHEDTSIPLPYSLKSPILNRAQVDETKKAAEAKRNADEKKAKAEAAAGTIKSALNLPGLPKALSVSVSNYLLDLLDSPAYANLTPNFLREVFNPLTPDREDIKYYSVASRTDKIPIWHPLWLPKQVLDGAESARRAKGIETRPEWVGNDGLVTIESAQWGEFLGVIENCDHWEMRGSSGLVSAAASAKAVSELTKSANEAISSHTNGDETNPEKKGWQWQDLYKVVGSSRNKSPTPAPAAVAAASPSNGNGNGASSNGQSEDAKGLAAFASWIVKILPGIPSKNGNGNNPSLASMVSNKSPTSSPASVVEDRRSGSIANSNSAAISNAARLQYGAPISSSSSDASIGSAEKTEKKIVTKEKEKFSLEQMTVAICRKLYNDGL